MEQEGVAVQKKEAESDKPGSGISDKTSTKWHIGIADEDVDVPKRRQCVNPRPLSEPKRNGVIFQDPNTSCQSDGTMDPSMLDAMIKQTQKSFVKTENYTLFYATLKEKCHVTIAGFPGEGKTSLALMLGVEYQKLGYDLVFVNDVDRFRLDDHLGQGRKVFLIFDDIFGTVGQRADVPKLKRMLRNLHTSMVDKLSKAQDQQHVSPTRAVFTSSFFLKSGVLPTEDQEFDMINGQTALDLSRVKTYQYSLEDKRKIFQTHKLHSGNTNVDFKEIGDLEQTSIGFPLTCKLFFYFNAIQSNPKDFFNQPLLFVMKEVEGILKQKENESAALILMILCDGIMNLHQVENEFQNTSLRDIFQSVQSMIPSTTGMEVSRSVRQLGGKYFTLGDTVEILHPTLFDICASALYSIAPIFILENCSLKFLFERVKDETTEAEPFPHRLQILYVSDDHEDIVAQRLAEAILTGGYRMSITHPILKREAMVDKLFDVLQLLKTSKYNKVKRVNKQLFYSKEHDTHLLYWSVQSHNLYLMQKVLVFGQFLDSEIADAFEACASYGNLPAMKFLIVKYKAIKQYSIHEALTFSTQSNRADMVKYLLGHCKDVTNDSLHKGWNLLVIARENVNFGIEMGIISAICKQRGISQMCRETSQLLHFASKNGDVQLAKYILPVTDIDTAIDGYAPVMTAAVYGQKDVFGLLVSKGADLNNRNKHNDSILHLASVGGCIQIVKQLLPRLDINLKGQDGRTAVMKAAVAGHKDLFDLLVSKSADLNLTDNYGNNILHCASSGGNTYIVEQLLPLSDINVKGHHGWTAVMRAVYNGQIAVFDLLVSKGADLTLTDEYGANVFHWACCGRSTYIVQQLLPQFDINIRGFNGFTPVMHSASHGQNDVFDLLVAKEADLKVKDNTGNNLLHWASCSSSHYIVEKLIPLFDINARGRDGFTPVMNAACYGQSQIFHLILSKGADLTLKNDHGSNMLYCASLGGNVNIIEHLFPMFDINSKGRNHMTPVMIAALEGKEEVFEFLIKKGSDLTLRDADGNNLLHLAHRGNSEVILGFLSSSRL